MFWGSLLVSIDKKGGQRLVVAEMMAHVLAEGLPNPNVFQKVVQDHHIQF